MPCNGMCKKLAYCASPQECEICMVTVGLVRLTKRLVYLDDVQSAQHLWNMSIYDAFGYVYIMITVSYGREQIVS